MEIQYLNIKLHEGLPDGYSIFECQASITISHPDIQYSSATHQLGSLRMDIQMSARWNLIFEDRSNSHQHDFEIMRSKVQGQIINQVLIRKGEIHIRMLS